MDHFFLKEVQPDEVQTAMELINDAKKYLKLQGIDQWQTGYPDFSIIQEDIANKRGYFLMDGGQSAAYLCIDFAGEPAYRTIDGKWKSELPYAVIHRMAISSAYRGQGLAGMIFHLAQDVCLGRGLHSLRADTDKDNTIMRHLLEKNGFVFCGTIWFDNSIKYAYEKLFI